MYISGYIIKFIDIPITHNKIKYYGIQMIPPKEKKQKQKKQKKQIIIIDRARTR